MLFTSKKLILYVPAHSHSALMVMELTDEPCTVELMQLEVLLMMAVKGPVTAVVGTKTATPSQLPKQVGYDILTSEKVCDRVMPVMMRVRASKIFFMVINLNGGHYF